MSARAWKERRGKRKFNWLRTHMGKGPMAERRKPARLRRRALAERGARRRAHIAEWWAKRWPWCNLLVQPDARITLHILACGAHPGRPPRWRG